LLTGTHGENSEVLLLLGLVAVAVTNWPASRMPEKVIRKLSLPLGPVVTVPTPMSRCPSPNPEGSQVSLAKNSIRKLVPGLLLSEPRMIVFPPGLPPLLVTEIKIGKF